MCRSVTDCFLVTLTYSSGRTSQSEELICLPSLSSENVPVEFLDPVYKDQHGQEHLKPGVSKLLLSSEIYCRVQSLLVQTHRASGSQASPSDNSALLQYLTKKGLSPKVQDVDVTEEDLSRVPIKTVTSCSSSAVGCVVV